MSAELNNWTIRFGEDLWDAIKDQLGSVYVDQTTALWDMYPEIERDWRMATVEAELYIQDRRDEFIAEVTGANKYIADLLEEAISKGLTYDEFWERAKNARVLDDQGRALSIYRTEISRACNHANVEHLHRWYHYTIYRISLGPKPCSMCEDAARKEYFWREAVDLLPFHPRCMCILYPLTERRGEVPEEWVDKLKERGEWVS
jgi:hypothetical protein